MKLLEVLVVRKGIRNSAKFVVPQDVFTITSKTAYFLIFSLHYCEACST
jgi:hypothetical protein